MNAIQKMLSGAVDYAGLFPPASLSMSETVANYARYRLDAARSILGRLVVPTSRLSELRQSIESLEIANPNLDSSPWQISALVPASAVSEYEDYHQALAQIVEFNRQYSKAEKSPSLVDSIEVKVNSPGELQRLADSRPLNLDCFFEIDCQTDPAAALEVLARTIRQPLPPSSGPVESSSLADSPSTKRLFAKIRTGSVLAPQIPSIEQVARFIAICARDYIPFKATAGLHHPIRNDYRLTYEPNAESGTMHGYLNLFVATLCAYEYQLNEQEISQILNERSAANFHFEDDRIQWHHLTIGLERIEALRSQSVQSFGSCSFTEPTSELCELYQCQFS